MADTQSVNRRLARRQLHRLVRGWTSLAGTTWTRRLWSEETLGRIADNRTRTLGKGEPKSEASNQRTRSGAFAIKAALSSRKLPAPHRNRAAHEPPNPARGGPLCRAARSQTL